MTGERNANQTEVTETPVQELNGASLSQDRQRLVEQLADMSPGLLYLYDVIEQRNIYVNARTFDLLGYPPETVLAGGRDFMAQVMHPEDQLQVAAHFEQLNAAADGSFLDIEYRMQHVSGEWRWFSSRDTVFNRTADGRVRQVLGTAQDITDRKREERRKAAQYGVARVLAEATTVVDAVPALLQALCESLEWQVGVIWGVDHDDHLLRYVNSWQAPTVNVPEFLAVSQQVTFAPGVGLPGRIWICRQPSWILEICEDPNFPRITAAVRGGLHTACGFPILLGHEILGVIECFSDRIWEPDEDLLQMMAAIGSQIGQFMERKRAELRLQESQRFIHQVADATPGILYIYDLIEQRNVYVNREIVEILGYTPEQAQAMGNQLFVQLMHPDDFATLPAHLERFDQAEDGEVIEREYRMRHASGEWRWLWSRDLIFSRTADGRPHQAIGISHDISDRKRAEAALAESNQTLQAIIQACPLAIMGLRSDGTVEIWNPAAERIFGWSQEEVLGQFLPAIPEDKREEFCENLVTTIQGQALSGVETQRQKKGGIPIDVALWSAAVDQTQARISCLSVVADISDRKQAERERMQLLAELQSKQRLLEAVLQQMPAGVMVAEAPTGRILMLNEQVQRIHRSHMWNAESVEDYTQYELLHPDGQPYTPQEKPLARALLNGDVVINEELDFIRADGSRGVLNASATPVRDAEGTIVAAVLTLYDMSDRKQMEEALRESEIQLQQANERFELAAAAVNCLIYDWDLKRDRVFRTEGLTRLLGYSLEEAEPTSRWWAERVHPDDLSRVSAEAEIALANSDRCVAEYRVRNKAGEYVYVQDHRIVMRDADGNIVRVVGSTIDIAERKQAEKEREHLLQRERAARESAEAANRIKDEFLAVLSHELRSPLNPILGWTTLLRTRKFDDQTRDRALETIERNARLQTQLIEDLLDVSRILQGKMALNIGPVNLAPVIEAAIETVRLAAEAKNIQIYKQLAIEVGPVSGDASRLQQIIWNLLSNAIKFTPEEGRVEIRLERVNGGDRGDRGDGGVISFLPSPSSSPSPPPTSYAQITITDTGKGIRPEFLPYVFDYFRQEDGTTTRRFGGLGLGLAIVRHLIELHGGTVQAESPGEGMGAIFTIRLPLLRSNGEEEMERREHTPSLPPPPAHPLTGLRILVVDDEADVRELLVMILEQSGAAVRSAASAADALNTLSSFNPDVLISDIGMPEVDGYMLMRQLRSLQSEGNSIPAIALTAYAGEADQQQALAAGFQHHLAKPVDASELVETVAALVKRKGHARRGYLL